jgi:hypothetical protein
MKEIGQAEKLQHLILQKPEIAPQSWMPSLISITCKLRCFPSPDVQRCICLLGTFIAEQACKKKPVIRLLRWSRCMRPLVEDIFLHIDKENSILFPLYGVGFDA